LTLTTRSFNLYVVRNHIPGDIVECGVWKGGSWYESTYHEMFHLYPRLVPGGVLIVDDYGHWQGARRAVDQYIAENGVKLLLNRIDYTARIGIKADWQ
jgi:hypothetical protein